MIPGPLDHSGPVWIFSLFRMNQHLLENKAKNTHLNTVKISLEFFDWFHLHNTKFDIKTYNLKSHFLPRTLTHIVNYKSKIVTVCLLTATGHVSALTGVIRVLLHAIFLANACIDHKRRHLHEQQLMMAASWLGNVCC